MLRQHLLPAATEFCTTRARTVDREVLVDLIVLAAVAGEHLLVLGPPGTAKSEAARRVRI